MSFSCGLYNYELNSHLFLINQLTHNINALKIAYTVILSEVTSTNLSCLDQPANVKNYLGPIESSFIQKTPNSKIDDSHFLHPNPGRTGEGGLRTLEYFKKSLPNMPLITVITVVFNGESHLEKTILSVLNQTYHNLEYIIIDGGSTDRTLKIIKQHEANIDYWVSENDNGIYDAMNKAAAVAKGDWLYFLGSDDILIDCIHKIAEDMTDKNTIYYGDVYMPGKHSIYTGELNGYELIFNNICHQAIFYPAEVFKKYLFQTKYKVLADHALNMICYGDKLFTFRYIPVLICIYNDTSGYSFSVSDPVFQDDRNSLVRDNFSLFDYIRYIIRMGLFRIKTMILRILNLES